MNHQQGLAVAVAPAPTPARSAPLAVLPARSYRRGLTAFALDYGALGVLLAAALLAERWWLQLASASAAGVMIGVLFVLGHDAAHNSLTPSSRLNRWLARLAFLPSLHALSLWVWGHNRLHHRFTNLASKDYVWAPLDLRGYRALSRPRRWLYRLYRSVFGPLAYYPLEIWSKRILFPTRRELGRVELQHVLDSAFVIGGALAYVWLLALGNAWHWFGATRPLWNTLLFGALVPFTIWNWLMGFVIYVQHTHPALVWYSDEGRWRERAVQAELAVHVLFPALVDRLFHHIMAHNAHHARVALPFYQLAQAQALLERDPTINITSFSWSPSVHLEVVRRCKLFDFEAGHWLDFDGRPTS